MLSRRMAVLGFLTAPLLSDGVLRGANATEKYLYQLPYPPLEALDNPEPFGYPPPSAMQKEKAAHIIRTTPTGPRPIDIAQSFIDRYYQDDPEAISQWPAPASWNPLIVEFFSATSLRANSDMIPWCAAFANWCIERAGMNGSRSAASQSFLSEKYFKRTDQPSVGDLAIWTCYDKITGKSLGLGHVAFVKKLPMKHSVTVIGGNQSGDGRSSIISEKSYRMNDREVRRYVGGTLIPSTMRLNSFVRLA